MGSRAKCSTTTSCTKEVGGACHKTNIKQAIENDTAQNGAKAISLIAHRHILIILIYMLVEAVHI